jgi:hypothetical protein
MNSEEGPLSLQDSHSNENIPGALEYADFPNWEIHRRIPEALVAQRVPRPRSK